MPRIINRRSFMCAAMVSPVAAEPLIKSATHTRIGRLSEMRVLAIEGARLDIAEACELKICRAVGVTAADLRAQAALLCEILEGSGLYRDGRDRSLAQALLTGLNNVRLSVEKA